MLETDIWTQTFWFQSPFAYTMSPLLPHVKTTWHRVDAQLMVAALTITFYFYGKRISLGSWQLKVGQGYQCEWCKDNHFANTVIVFITFSLLQCSEFRDFVLMLMLIKSDGLHFFKRSSQPLICLPSSGPRCPAAPKHLHVHGIPVHNG